jgi:predicted secreted protein
MPLRDDAASPMPTRTAPGAAIVTPARWPRAALALAACGLLLLHAAVPARAQAASARTPMGEAAGACRCTAGDPPSPSVLSLNAQAATEVVPDTLTLVLRVTRQGADAARLQTQLQQVLDLALQEARAAAKPPALEVRTGSFQVTPRYGNAGSIVGWQGLAELILSGRDVAALAALAGRLGNLQVVGNSFAVSPAQRERSEAELLDKALASFRQKAAAAAQGLGFQRYVVREVTVASGEVEARIMPMVSARAMVADAAAAPPPLPVEAGTQRVSVQVAGSIYLVDPR